MKIAHLILAHKDFEHINRLARRLADISDIYIHIDANVDDKQIREYLSDVDNCYFVETRFHCEWGGVQCCFSRN